MYNLDVGFQHLPKFVPFTALCENIVGMQYVPKILQ